MQILRIHNAFTQIARNMCKEVHLAPVRPVIINQISIIHYIPESPVAKKVIDPNVIQILRLIFSEICIKRKILSSEDIIVAVI